MFHGGDIRVVPTHLVSKQLFFRIGVGEYVDFICVGHLFSILCCVLSLVFVGLRCVFCFSCLRIAHFWLSLRFSLTFILFALYMTWFLGHRIQKKMSYVADVFGVLDPCRSNKLICYVGDSIIMKKRAAIPLTDLIRTHFCTCLFQTRTCIYIP